MTDDAGTRPGIGATIGDVGKEPMQVCKTLKFTAERGASFALTIGPLRLSLILPGASLPRLAARQTHLLHSINCKVSSKDKDCSTKDTIAQLFCEYSKSELNSLHLTAIPSGVLQILRGAPERGYGGRALLPTPETKIDDLTAKSMVFCMTGIGQYHLETQIGHVAIFVYIM